MRLFLGVLILTGPLVANIVPFEDCGSSYYLESVEISDCNDYPCRLTVGSTVNVTAYIIAPASDMVPENLIQEVYFEVNKVRRAASVTTVDDPCTTAGTCDVPSEQKSQYRAMLAVNDVPPLPATLYWRVKNKAEETVICYKVTVILTN